MASNTNHSVPSQSFATRSRPRYFMRDQVRGKVPVLMNEGWRESPIGAAVSLVVLVAAFSVLGTSGSAEAAESLALLEGWLK